MRDHIINSAAHPYTSFTVSAKKNKPVLALLRVCRFMSHTTLTAQGCPTALVLNQEGLH